MTPFENAANFVHSLAGGLYCSYAMLNYVPVLEDLERHSLAATMCGNAQLVASLAQLQNTIQREVSALAYEA